MGTIQQEKISWLFPDILPPLMNLLEICDPDSGDWGFVIYNLMQTQRKWKHQSNKLFYVHCVIKICQRTKFFLFCINIHYTLWFTFEFFVWTKNEDINHRTLKSLIKFFNKLTDARMVGSNALNELIDCVKDADDEPIHIHAISSINTTWDSIQCYPILIM